MKKDIVSKTYRVIKAMMVFVVLFAVSCKSNDLPNVDEIWEKYLNTVASRETVRNIKTSYKITESKRKNGVYRTIHTIKAPDKICSEVIYPDNTRIFVIMNGKKGIVKRNGIKVHEMDEYELTLNSELALIFPEYTYTSKNNDIKYVGIINEKGNEYYKIKLNRWADKNVYYLIDKSTFEFYKMISDNRTLSEVIKRKNIMGVNTFWTMKNFYEKDTVIDQIIENKFNIEVNDSIFKLD